MPDLISPVGLSSAPGLDTEAARTRDDLPANDSYWFLDEETQRKVDAVKGWEPINKLVTESEKDAIEKLAAELNVKLDDQTKDYLMQYYLDEKRAENTQLRQTQAEKDYYPNLVEGLSKAGINPMLALSGLSGGGTGASSGSSSGGLYTSSKNADKQNGANIGKTLMMIFGMIAVAILHAL